tara:strand:- start:2257 stop:2688 length:432 start_codon:yes stop_codon:yes gene_type:complete
MDPRSPSQVVIDRVGNAAEEFTEEMVAVAIMQVKENLGPELGISPSTLSLVIKYTMEAVEKTPTKGPAQMGFALRVIGDLIGELPSSDEKAFLSQTLDNGGIKNTIELIVQATRGEINVNQVVEVAAKSCLQPCIDYIASKCR